MIKTEKKMATSTRCTCNFMANSHKAQHCSAEHQTVIQILLNTFAHFTGPSSQSQVKANNLPNIFFSGFTYTNIKVVKNTKIWLFLNLGHFLTEFMQECRPWGCTPRFWLISQTYFNQGGGDRLCPPNYYWHTRIFGPSDGPAYVMHGYKSLLSTLISLISMEVGINVEGVQKLPNH